MVQQETSQKCSNSVSKPNNSIDNGIVIGTGNGNNIQIRAATPSDTKGIRGLIQELAVHQDMPDGPKSGAEQLAADLKAARMHSMVAMDASGEMAAYAMYFLPSSNAVGQYMFLEDLYIRVPYRRKGLGIRMLQELAKIAHTMRLPFIEWDVLRSNPGAIKFYHTLEGIQDMTDGKKEGSATEKWRLPVEAFQGVLKRAEQAGIGMDVEVVLDDETGQIGEKLAHQLAEQWHQLVAEESEKKQKPHLDTNELAKQLQKGQLGAVVVKNDDDDNSQLLGMALFHRKAYSSWTGPYVVLDHLVVQKQQRRHRIGTAMMAELVKLAQQMNAVRIQWIASAPEPSSTDPTADECKSFFESLKAINLAEAEGWLLYRWHYKQSGLLEA